MTEPSVLPPAITAYGVVTIPRFAPPRAGWDGRDHHAPFLPPRGRVVTARWHRNERGRLEMSWLPATAAPA
jgi:hypothetical protein